MRVLKPSGSLFVNLGDKYSGGSSGDRNSGFNERSGNSPGARAQERSQIRGVPAAGFRPKTLLGLPWRYAIGCIDQLGLILRAEIVWAKPNGLPESVTDRVRRSHEQWFHFTQQPRYYAAVDEIRLPNVRTPRPSELNGTAASKYGDGVPGSTPHVKLRSGKWNSLGSLPGSVWEVPTEPLTVPAHLGVDHFAAFPTAWPKRLILGWSPSGICTACDEGRRPVVDRPGVLGGDNNPYSRDGSKTKSTLDGGAREWRLRMATPDTLTGYACACPDTSAPTRPATVLDPFGGTGTTAAVASALGRIGVSVDLSHDYSRLAQWRTADPATRAKIRGERPPVKQMDGQLGIFDGLEVAG